MIVLKMKQSRGLLIMKNTSFITFFLLMMGVSVSAFAADSACLKDCKRNYSTTPSELQACITKCDGSYTATPVITDSVNEDTRDVKNPQNSADPHRN